MAVRKGQSFANENIDEGKKSCLLKYAQSFVRSLCTHLLDSNLNTEIFTRSCSEVSFFWGFI